MNPSLLHQLLPDDIQWLLDQGEQQMYPAAATLTRLETPSAATLHSPSQTGDRPEPGPESLPNSGPKSGSAPQTHLILEGSLSLSFALHSPPQSDSASQAAPPIQELFPLQGGDLWGQVPFVSQFLPQGQLKTLAPTLVLSLERSRLERKLLQDPPFAARFYRLLAQLLAKRLAYLTSRCPYSLGLLKQLQLKEASTLFAALEDSDLDWLAAVGEVRDCRPGDRITRLYQPLEALQIVLEGALSLVAPEQPIPPVYAAFVPPSQLPREVEFARLSRGELLGDGFLVDPLPPAYAALALRPTQLLSIPRWRLETKLIYDARFAAQLYRVLTILLSNKQHSLMSSIGFQLPLQELDEQLLHQVNLAESRFDWLLQRLQAQSVPTGLAASV